MSSPKLLVYVRLAMLLPLHPRVLVALSGVYNWPRHAQAFRLAGRLHPRVPMPRLRLLTLTRRVVLEAHPSLGESIPQPLCILLRRVRLGRRFALSRGVFVLSPVQHVRIALLCPVLRALLPIRLA
jgi:hypothetical protein